MVVHANARRGRATSFVEVAGPYERGRPGYLEDAVRSWERRAMTYAEAPV